MSNPTGPAPIVYCLAEVLAGGELAAYKLPHPTRVSQLELYREVLDSESTFTAFVEALEASGRFSKRADGTYRVWDAYLILEELGRHARLILPGPPRVEARLVVFPFLYLLHKLGESWWEPVESVRVGLTALWRARYPDLIKDPAHGRLRDETYDEVAQRLSTLHPAIRQEMKAIAERLPDDKVFWKEHLGTHAWLVVTLRNAHFESLARLCADQLDAAVELAEVRLGKTRRAIRALVGHMNADMTAPALTAASFSIAWKAFDAALDEMELALPHYNAAMTAALQLAPDQPEKFLQFLTESGLQEWYTQLSIVTWRRMVLTDMSEDQRIALVYGRVRTLCALLEEALLSLAEYTGHAAFRAAIEKQPTLHPRLLRFLRGPGHPSQIVNRKRVGDLAVGNSIKPDTTSQEAEARFLALGIPSGNAPPQTPQTPEQVLASLIVARNLTSHRFPIVQGGARVRWFEAWGEHLPGINRAVLWAGMMLWAIAVHHKAHP